MCSPDDEKEANFLRILEAEYDQKSRDFQPWRALSEQDRQEQRCIQQILSRRSGSRFGENCFVARGAVILGKLVLGAHSCIASGAIIRGRVRIGSRSTVNPFAHIAGKVTIGSGVRIAGLVSIYGFNHGHKRIDVPIYKQNQTSIGINIGSGTWIGANAVIVDGVEIGEHSVVAGGAVVTKSFGPYQIIGGNPARVIRERREVSEKSLAK